MNINVKIKMTRNMPAPAYATDGAAAMDLRAALDEGEITNVATHPDHRCRGAARAVLGLLLVEAKARGIPPAEAEGYLTIEGRGVAADLPDARYFAGSPALLAEDLGIDLAPMQGAIEELLSMRCSIVCLAKDEAPLGVIGVADTAHPEAAGAVAELAAMGVRPLMMTGDNPRAAAEIAGAVGITEIYARLTPEG